MPTPRADVASGKATTTDDAPFSAKILDRVPAKRWGRIEDFCAVAVFLASEGCRYMTGNTLFVGGGTHINGSAWAPKLPD